MKIFTIFSLTTFFITAISCATNKKKLIPAPITSNISPIEENLSAKEETKKKEFEVERKLESEKETFNYEQFFLSIPINTSDDKALLNADFFEPPSKFKKNALIIMVPGSGNVSRKGEVSSDGINSFSPAYLQTYAWSKALSERGFFVLSYDKRTCVKSINNICNDNPQKDINELGINALSADLDQVCAFAKKELRQFEKIILMSNTQGAQVISQSNCLKEASQVVLLSPILENLSDFLVSGLERASEKEVNFYVKNNLLNRKESTKVFFRSLEQNEFNKSAQIKGASLSFWLSWIESSKNTLKNLESLPVLVLFSSLDPFLSPKVLSMAPKNIRIIKIEKSDNLLLRDKELSTDAIDLVEQFLSSKIPLS